jgi:hypothetical protein
MASPPTITTKPMWRLRADLSLTRWLVTAAAITGILATVRLTLAPPQPQSASAPVAAAPDYAAEGFAEQFVRTLLTYDSSRPDVRRRALAAFAAAALDPDAGFVPPPSGSQQVQWARVVQQRDPRPGEHVYTVAAQTDRSGLLHLAVEVRRDRDGTLRLSGYPGLVGPPASAPIGVDPDAPLRDVDDPELEATVARALHNYLAGDANQLAADLVPGTRVVVPEQEVRVAGLDALKWSRDGGSVIATVTGTGGDSARWTLRYELDAQRLAGRWEVSTIENAPS